ncbi:hypothetical protein SLA2020_166740 [Shorea laevis]
MTLPHFTGTSHEDWYRLLLNGTSHDPAGLPLLTHPRRELQWKNNKKLQSFLSCRQIPILVRHIKTCISLVPSENVVRWSWVLPSLGNCNLWIDHCSPICDSSLRYHES